MKLQAKALTSLHDPSFVRHCLAFLMDPGSGNLNYFLKDLSPASCLTLFHQCAIELAFHPHLDWQNKYRMNQIMCQHVLAWPVKLRRTLTLELPAILERLLIFAGQGRDLSQYRDISPCELTVWFHDELIDSLFGLDYLTIEGESQEHTLSLAHQALASSGLNSSYLDFYRIFQHWCNTGPQIWCDIGCGMGRSLLLAASCFPHIKPIGIEKCPARLRALRKTMMSLRLSRIDIREVDMLEPGWSLPAANCYFVYINYEQVFDQVMEQLERLAFQSPYPFRIIAIESHGDTIPILSYCFPWLKKEQKQLSVSSPRSQPEIVAFQLQTNSTPSKPSIEHTAISPSQIRSLLRDKENLKNWLALYLDSQNSAIIAASLHQARLEGIDGKLVLQTTFPPKSISINEHNSNTRLISVQPVAHLDQSLLQKAASYMAEGIACQIFHTAFERWIAIGRVEKLWLKPRIYVEGSRLGLIPITNFNDIRPEPE